MGRPVRVGIVQCAPVFLNLEASVERARDWIERASSEGSELVVFGETWLTGYPVWVDAAPEAARWDHAPARALHRRLLAQSATLDSAPIASLTTCAAASGCDVVMGLHERRGGSLYNTLVVLGREGTIRHVHRKLVPTHGERMVWARGDGSTLETIPSAAGRLGGLVCWEHWMPLARAALHARDERVHVAQWPTVHELHQLASRHYAFEGGCFVLAAGSVLTRGQVLTGYRSLGADSGVELLESIPGAEDTPLLRGGSMIVGPDAAVLAGPVFDVETVVTAEIDIAHTDEARLTLDTSGHYARPDVFRLEVDVRPQVGVDFREGAAEPETGDQP